MARSRTRIRIEPIKPQPGRGKARAVYNRVLRDTLEREAKDVKKDLDKTVKTWRNKPTFTIKVARGKSRLGVTVTTNDKVYSYVDQGTKPHPIRPKKASVLRFRTGYVAKTKPGRLISRGGGAKGETVFAKEVLHPGSKPRNFTKLVARRGQKRVQKRIDRAIKKANAEVNRNRARGQK